jgi:hypothetical protein
LLGLAVQRTEVEELIYFALAYIVEEEVYLKAYYIVQEDKYLKAHFAPEHIVEAYFALDCIEGEGIDTAFDYIA